MSVRRWVAWPYDTSAVARSLSRSPAWFWLDGEAPEPDGSRGRSYLGESLDVRLALRGEEQRFLDGLRDEEADDGIPCWIVALSYEFGVALMGLDPAPDDAAPAFALRTNTVLVLNHHTGTAELRGPNNEAIDAWMRQHGEALTLRPRVHLLDAEPEPRPVAWRKSQSTYERDVERCKDAIRDGDAYVLCLTDTAEVSGDFNPLETFLRLRGTQADQLAVRGAVIVAGTRALVSSSPERFLSVQNGQAHTHPIKGSRPRQPDAVSDAAQAAELAADPKERAENLMIVDLMRNDLSRVSLPGTVATSGFLRVETHPSVHQLVSTIRGSLVPGLDALDVLKACFPGGSMTGAPKHQAVRILAELEQAPRGLYSGCFGWLGIETGSQGTREVSAELAMSIRCIELRACGTEAAHARVGAGGGITIDSVADHESAEKRFKSAPLFAALGIDESALRA